MNPEKTFFDKDEEDQTIINARKYDMTFDHKLTLPDVGTHTRGGSNVVHVARHEIPQLNLNDSNILESVVAELSEYSLSWTNQLLILNLACSILKELSDIAANTQNEARNQFIQYQASVVDVGKTSSLQESDVWRNTVSTESDFVTQDRFHIGVLKKNLISDRHPRTLCADLRNETLTKFQARDWHTTEIPRAIENGVHLAILDKHTARISMFEEHIQFVVQHGRRFHIIEFIVSEEHIDKYRARSYNKFPREVFKIITFMGI